MAWHCKAMGGYAMDSSEALDNANEIYGMLNARGWTLNSICGLLGNIGVESGYNPWRWQSDHIGSSTGSPWTNMGYGLTQFTPASKYIDSTAAKGFAGYGPNFSDKTGSTGEGYAQVLFFDQYADYYPTTAYPMTYAQFKASEETPAYLASVWLYNYERPGDPGATESIRRDNANYWYQVLSGEEPPPDPDPPGPGPSPGTGRKLPLWMYGKPWYLRL